MDLQNLQNQPPDFSKSTAFECGDCGSSVFDMSYVLREFSPLVSPTGQATIIPIQVFACAKCKWVSEAFLPDGGEA